MNSPFDTHDSAEDSEWKSVEKVVRGQIAAEVRCKENHTSGNPPLYSLRIGRVRIAPDTSVWISPHMSVYDLHIACELIDELGEKYRGLRQTQTGRRVVEQKRSTPRMSLSRDGTLEPARTLGPGVRRFYNDEGED